MWQDALKGNQFVYGILTIYVLTYLSLLDPSTPNSLPPGLSPLARDIGHLMLTLMDFGRAYGLEVDDKHKGRPMMWETHKV